MPHAPAQLLLVSGSLRSGSTNAALLRTAVDVAPDGIETSLYEGIGSLPHFNPDDDEEGVAVPGAVAGMRSRIAASDAILFCTPEYAGTLPGSFKNLLDWTVGGGETYGMPVGWVNVAGPGRGAGAEESLRTVLTYTGTEIVEEACVRIPVARDMVGEDGRIADAAAREQLAAALRALAAAGLARRARDDA